ncbi:MAG: TIGR02587 family membrane protein [Hyphomonadaceae bacterium]|nr:TIGR02587 family membrane protein [Hyphomonadaceae bacterium]
MHDNTAYARGLGRAFVGALLFALPLFMTMEMWEVGATGDPLRLAALLVATFPLLVGLSYFAGFEHAFGLVDHLLDAFAAVAIAAVTGTLALALFGVLSPQHPLTELIGKVAVVTFPAALGALLADKQLGRSAADEDGETRNYWVRLFLMLVGALFISLNVAPTEEMVLISYQIGPLQAALLALVSLALLHALLFWVDLKRRDDPPRQNFLSVLIRYSFAGYAICMLVSLFLLWVFGRTDGVPLESVIAYVVVLSFAGALGAGLAHAVVAERRD